ncbi:hypothetical protein QJS10_CPB21g00564 [Acorus calamus]|uniref:Uncharacterized protein n=1 Tax=Acorus calamus TaxID=4465 RepID=A0AAV9C6S0_ACOCL|nr:hypothetical protein QJS10_CPB21g00564 [Acorus calamus]
MWRRLVKTLSKERYPSMRGILTSAFGWSAKENVYLPNLNIFKNDDSSLKIKALEKEIENLKSELFKPKDIRPGTLYMDTDHEFVPRKIVKEAYALFNQILESKIEAEGEDFLRVDSESYQLLPKLDLEELKHKYPLITESDYKNLLGDRILLFQLCKDIETRHKLMEFLLENDYEEGWNEEAEWLEKHRAELDQILSEIITYTNDKNIRSWFRTDPHLDSTSWHFFEVINEGSKFKSKEEKLTLLKEDRDKSLHDVKEWYRRIITYEDSEEDEVILQVYNGVYMP